MIWVGVDPGAKTIGVVARCRTDLVGSVLVRVEAFEPGAVRPGRATLEQVTEAVYLAAGTRDLSGFRVAVEDTVRPSAYIRGKLRIIDPTDLLRCAEVVGHVREAFPDVVLVPPKGNGSNALLSYPRALVGPVEAANATRKRTWALPAGQSGDLRHLRSAWDVAGAAAIAERLAAARALAAERAATRTPPQTRRGSTRRRTG